MVSFRRVNSDLGMASHCKYGFFRFAAFSACVWDLTTMHCLVLHHATVWYSMCIYSYKSMHRRISC
jgi:hypothetical protein